MGNEQTELLNMDIRALALRWRIAEHPLRRKRARVFMRKFGHLSALRIATVIGTGDYALIKEESGYYGA